MTTVLLFLAALLVTGLLVGAGILWLVCKVFKVPNVTFGRALATVVLFCILGMAGNLSFMYLSEAHGLVIAVLIDFTVVNFLFFFSIQLLLRTSLGKTFLVGLSWLVLHLACSLGLAFGVKQTIAEAFVNPTGAMAETLLGYHKMATCPQCGHAFPVNASMEANSYPGMPPTRVESCICPNCRANVSFDAEHVPVPLQGGDRIFVFHRGYGNLQRHDLMVFEFPPQPRRDGMPLIYVKRVAGLPGETLGIYQGDLYVAEGLHTPDQAEPEELCQPSHMHRDEDVEQLKKDAVRPHQADGRRFHILRKSPEQILALRRLVHDNDRQARDLSGQAAYQRWAAAEAVNSWQPDSVAEPRGFRHAAGPSEAISWLRYRHVFRDSARDGKDQPKPELVTDFLGYNTGNQHDQSPNWVGDLILEGQVQVEKPEGELWLELSRGADRFQARFQLDSGDCQLVRRTADGEAALGSQPTRLKQPGTYRLRFANVDQRLTLWVDSDLPFGHGVEYDPPRQSGPTVNDLQPASIGAKGAAVNVTHLQLWRDTYYTINGPQADVALRGADLSDPGEWDKLREMPARTMYVQPGHYLGLGDNSSQSSDSREWGLVPERLLVGKAVLIYYPFARAGQLR